MRKVTFEWMGKIPRRFPNPPLVFDSPVVCMELHSRWRLPFPFSDPVARHQRHLFQDDSLWLSLLTEIASHSNAFFVLRYASVKRTPTSATEPSVQLDFQSETICRRTSDSRIFRIYSRFRQSLWTFLYWWQSLYIVWSVGPKRSVNAPLTAL